MLYDLLRPLLFRLDPETAHHLSLAALQGLSRLGPFNPLQRPAGANSLRVMGLDFPNPVGLAAGLDKNGECIDGLAALGFGFIEIGTVTPRPQPGNPRPRLFRLPAAEALINRMGFNNKGVDYLVEQVKKARFRGILGINIGKNRDTPLDRALDDYRIGLRKVYPHASYVTVNISSPNTPGLRDLQAGENLEHLLSGLRQEREELEQNHGRRVPLAVKIAPDLEPGQLDHLAEALVEHGIDAVIATNTTASREGVEGLPHGNEAGGLSGRPLLARSTDIVAQLSDALHGAVPIIGCGGIAGADDARRKFAAGAALIQIYTGFVYRGPSLIREIVETA
jgi:dihydroorotate dehydrogenase